MRQRSLILCVLAGLLVGFASADATAQDVNVVVECPAEGAPLSTPTVVIVYTSFACSAVPIRTMSSIVGNSDQTLGGIGVFGPVVIDDRMLPGGSGATSGCGCNAGSCGCIDGSAISCTSDADCPFCRKVTPYLLNVEKDALPAIPVSLDGTVATYVFITEVVAGPETSTEINKCFVEVL